MLLLPPSSFFMKTNLLNRESSNSGLKLIYNGVYTTVAVVCVRTETHITAHQQVRVGAAQLLNGTDNGGVRAVSVAPDTVLINNKFEKKHLKIYTQHVQSDLFVIILKKYIF